MIFRTAFIGFIFLFIGKVAFAQEGNPLDSIEIRVNEEMVAVASAILESTRTGTVQQGDDFFNSFLGTNGVTNNVENMVGYSRENLLSLSIMDEARLDWSYWPRPRVGLTLGEMTSSQRTMVHDLLNTALTSMGYLKVIHIMQLEEVLNVQENIGLPRGNEQYWLTFFGTPSMEEHWGWRFEGHHVSLNIWVSPAGGIRVTPTFFGADPAEIRGGALAGFRPHSVVEDLGRDLILSLSEEDREVAILSDNAPMEILATPIFKARDDWETWRQTLQPEGVSVADLSGTQRHIVQRILNEVVTAYRPEISAAYLKTIQIDELSFAWMGSRERGGPHYYRLQGTDFVFEYDNVQGGANHVHTVWRSKRGDFGGDLLPEHYRMSHR
jgi:hypothetical protein|tara:strand:- start:1229 stop:2374 length:1146 start_codon:yes stop_codon:yes gene_type:complete